MEVVGVEEKGGGGVVWVVGIEVCVGGFDVCLVVVVLGE